MTAESGVTDPLKRIGWRTLVMVAAVGVSGCGVLAAEPASPPGPTVTWTPRDGAPCAGPAQEVVPRPVDLECPDALAAEGGTSLVQLTNDDGTTRWIWITFVPAVVVLAAVLLF